MNYPTQKIFSNAAARAVRSKMVAALLALGAISVALPAHADLQNSALLTIVRPTTFNPFVQPTDGSWFSMSGGTYAALEGFDGLRLGTTQTASGSHSGTPGCTNGVGTCNNTGELPGIDRPWEFFGNTGMHFSAIATNVLTASGNTATVSFSGWRVTWNGIASINMGGGTQIYNNQTYNNGTGIATITCQNTCADGETYTLDYDAVVPQGDPSNFGGVPYHLHLVGRIVSGPLAVNDNSVTTMGNAVTINVLANDAAPNGIDLTSVVVGSPTNGTALANATTGVVTYTPALGFSGTDTFTYTFRDRAGTPVTSNSATVTVAVHVNTAPTAVDDTASAIAGTSTAIAVLANDTDVDGTTASGNINPATVTVVLPPQLAGASAGVNTTTGAITYTAGSMAGSDSFTYTVRDADGAVSNVATVNVTVRTYSGDWTNPIAPGAVPILFIEGGSYFTMELSLGNPVQTNLTAGVDGGVILGTQQFAGGSHTGAPTGSEVTGIDQPWSFFSNTGMHYTANGGIGVNTADGTLNFDNRWFVTWNSLPAINMGGSPQDNAVVRGKAAIVCSNPTPCADGSTYSLNYSAHVPLGDPSGFGGVPYGLHLQGHVRFLDTVPTSDGSISQGSLGLGMRLTATQLINAGIPADTSAGTQCVGDCFDFQVTGLTLGRAKVVLPLIFGIRPNSTYRKFTGGAWHDFDTTTLTNGAADTLKSAPLLPGTATCPAINHASYTPGLTVGNRCVQLDIADNGPNDASAVVGTVADPGGVAAGAVVVPADTRTTSSSGCSMTTRSIKPLDRGDWWLLLGFVAWLGFVARRKRA